MVHVYTWSVMCRLLLDMTTGLILYSLLLSQYRSTLQRSLSEYTYIANRILNSVVA